MDKQQVSKIQRGSLVLYTTSSARKYAYEQPGVLVKADLVPVQGRRYPYKETLKSGAVIAPIVGNGTDARPFKLADDNVKVPNAGVRGVIATRSDLEAHGGTSLDFCRALVAWQEAAQNKAAEDAKRRRAEQVVIVQERMDWIRSFGLTAHYSGHLEGIQGDGYSSDIVLDRNGKVSMSFDILEGFTLGE